MEKYRSGLLKKWKEYGTSTNLPRAGRPPKLTDQARRALIRGNKETKITLKELQSSTEEIGVSVHRTTLSHTLHRAGLYGRVSRKKKPLLKEKISKHVVFTKRHVGDSPNIWKKVLWSDETKIEIFGHRGTFLVQTRHLSSPRKHQCRSDAWWWQHHAVGMFFIGRDWETGQNYGWH